MLLKLLSTYYEVHLGYPIPLNSLPLKRTGATPLGIVSTARICSPLPPPKLTIQTSTREEFAWKVER
jgi:hypothetical protein